MHVPKKPQKRSGRSRSDKDESDSSAAHTASVLLLSGVAFTVYLIYDRSDDRSTAAIVAEDKPIIAAAGVFAITAFLLLYVFN